MNIIWDVIWEHFDDEFDKIAKDRGGIFPIEWDEQKRILESVVEKYLEMQEPDVCPRCFGFTNVSDRQAVIVCPTCKGTGKASRVTFRPPTNEELEALSDLKNKTRFA